MPSLLGSTLPACISNLPVELHSVEVDSEFWKPHFSVAGIGSMHQLIFSSHASIRIPRDRLLNHVYSSPEQKCAEILLWGYPNNMRGIVSKLLPQLPALASASQASLAWPAYHDGFPKGTGTSTTTKLAYFHKRSFNGQQALILDNVLAGEVQKWQEILAIPGLAPNKGGIQHYLPYLDAMHSTASQLGCSGDQLELFLFSIGKHFY